MAKKMTYALKEGGTVLAVLGGNYVASYAAGKHHDLRTGFGRRDGEELPLVKDYRVVGAAIGAVANIAGQMTGNELLRSAGRETVVSLGTSVTSTEAVRVRVQQAVESQAVGKVTNQYADLD